MVPAVVSSAEAAVAASAARMTSTAGFNESALQLQ
jgi:hypothetical protein